MECPHCHGDGNEPVERPIQGGDSDITRNMQKQMARKADEGN
jgi:hypothetical protein